MSSGPLQLLVVDDHPIVRNGVALLLQSTTSIAMAGYAHSGAEAVEAAQRLQPDVVLLDLRLPDMLAPEILPLLRHYSPRSRVVIFTAYADHAAIEAAIDAGADAVLTKDAGRDDLLEVIRRVAAGERLTSVEIVPARIRHKLQMCPLTRQEYAVFRRMATGETTAEIAEALNLAANTVKTYLQRAMQKLGAHNRVEAINKANEIGLL